MRSGLELGPGPSVWDCISTVRKGLSLRALPFPDIVVVIFATSGSRWTTNTLLGLNIAIQEVDALTFFGNANLPAPNAHLLILGHQFAPPDIPLPGHVEPLKENIDMAHVDIFFQRLQEVLHEVHEGVVTDFATHLLEHVVGLAPPPRIIEHQSNFTFLMGGMRVSAKPDLNIREGVGNLLLIQEDKVTLQSLPGYSTAVADNTKRRTRTYHEDRAEPQLVAEFVGAYRSDESRRAREGLPAIVLPHTYFGLIMTGVAPRFYKIVITTDFLNAVNASQPAPVQVVVERFTPPVPDPENFDFDGMEPLNNRWVCMQAFEALRLKLL